MRKQFYASPISKGNQLFRASVTITSEGVSFRVPGFWKNKETYFKFQDITGISLNSPRWYSIASFVTIQLNARGTWVEIHGFTRGDGNEIKRLIEVNQNADATEESNFSLIEKQRIEHESNIQSMKDSIADIAREHLTITEENIHLAKNALIKTLTLRYIYRYQNNNEEEALIQIEIKKVKKLLLKYLTDGFLTEKPSINKNRYNSILEDCRAIAKMDAITKIKRVNAINENTIWDNLLLEAKARDMKIDFLIAQYDQLDIEALENEPSIKKYNVIVKKFVTNIAAIEGRKMLARYIVQLIDKNHQDYYLLTLLDLLNLIEGIYELELSENEETTKYPFALNHAKVINFLQDNNRSESDRLTKVIDVTDNLIDRLSKRGM